MNILKYFMFTEEDQSTNYSAYQVKKIPDLDSRLGLVKTYIDENQGSNLYTYKLSKNTYIIRRCVRNNLCYDTIINTTDIPSDYEILLTEEAPRYAYRGTRADALAIYPDVEFVIDIPKSVEWHVLEYHEEKKELIFDTVKKAILNGELGTGSGAILPFVVEKFEVISNSVEESNKLADKFLELATDLSELQHPHQLRDYYLIYEMVTYLREYVLNKADSEIRTRLEELLKLYAISEFMENLILYEHTVAFNPTMNPKGMEELLISFLDFLEGQKAK